jgi:hypothetical protein
VTAEEVVVDWEGESAGAVLFEIEGAFGKTGGSVPAAIFGLAVCGENGQEHQQE